MLHDLVIVGGGLAGATLGACMARAGARVLILERAKQFHDRVRGEGIHPWGIPELRALGLYRKLIDTCALEIRYRASYLGTALESERDLVETTLHHSPAVDFYHPEMQEVLLKEAIETGVEVHRGVAAIQVTGGSSPSVVVLINGNEQRFRARLVVGADGRQSVARRDGAFKVSRDPNWLRISGALLEGMGAPENAVHTFVPPDFGQTSLLFPIGEGRIRTYFATGRRTEQRALTGPEDLADLADYCVQTGVPRKWFDHAHLVGPLATFEGADVWVEHPYKDGLVLIGDAAAANDPCWGCGLSLTLRDVRVLRDALVASEDWDAACRRYAAEHDRYYGALHRITCWLAEVRYTVGPEGDQLREHALPKLTDGKPRFARLLGQPSM
jgi:2-polyprenyl-6-methoxyphenol hydroxylase-like FAD-dependent oxidoreductase